MFANPGCCARFTAFRSFEGDTGGADAIGPAPLRQVFCFSTPHYLLLSRAPGSGAIHAYASVYLYLWSEHHFPPSKKQDLGGGGGVRRKDCRLQYLPVAPSLDYSIYR